MTHTIDRPSNETQTNFSSQINSILKEREKFAQKVQNVKNNIIHLLKCLESLNSEQRQIVSGLKDQRTKVKLENVNFQNPIKKLKEEQIKLKKLQSRFGRKTINIAVVGMAGQGKSRLLQTLTGLNKDLIPDGEDDDCTAVRSNIYHRAELGDRINITVKYHNEESFFENVILPYYDQLEITPQPKSLEEFAAAQLRENSFTKQIDTDKYDHLKTYHDQLDKYRHLLKRDFEQEDKKQENKTNVSSAELRKILTQDNQSENQSFEHLAVKEVDIFCSLPKSDIGDITFIDMPGLGDGKINNYQSLLQTLGEDIDLVLFMRMPNKVYRKTNDLDSAFYDLADSAIPNLPIKQWSFYVINYFPQQENMPSCIKFQERIKQKNIVAEAVIANCADEEEANKNILAPVLNYLTTNLNDLDKQYAKQCQHELDSVQCDIEAELRKASISIQKTTASNFGDLTTSYTDWFNKEFFDELGIQLNSLADDMTKKANEVANNNDDDNFKNIVNQKIQHWNNKNFLPEQKQIEEKIREFGKEQYPAAIASLFNIIKGDIAQPFSNINLLLTQSLKSSQLDIANVLINCGGLGIINPGDSQFFNDFENKIPDGLVIPHLKEAIIFVKEYNVSYEAIITKIITAQSEKYLKYTPNVWEIVPGITKNKIRNNPEYFILKVLTEQCQKVINNSIEEIRKLSLNPPQEFASMVRQFRDKAFLNPQVKDDWRKFLSYYVAEIWSNQSSSDANDTKFKKDWMHIVEDTKQANSLEALKFSS